MKKTHLIILGAGKPHLGKDPSALLKVFENMHSLNFLLNFAKQLKIRTTYVSGYKNNKIKRKFPNLKIVYNKNWKKTGPVYSLNNVKINDDENIIVLYSDVLIRFETFKRLVENNDEVLCLIDSKYKNR